MHAALWLGILAANLAHPAPPSPLAWSPDGRWLAYVQEVRPVHLPVRSGWLFEVGEAGERAVRDADPPRAAGAYRLWVTRPETGESVLLEESRGPLSAACWRRDGASLAFGRLRRGSDASPGWEIVVQDAPDRQRVLRHEPLAEPCPSADAILALTLAWSPDGRTLAAPGLQPPALSLLRAADGRVERTLEGATRPAFAPDGPRFAYVREGKEPGLYVMDAGGETRRLTETASEPERLPAPVWSHDGQVLMSFRRAMRAGSPEVRGGRSDLLQLVRTRADTGRIESVVDLEHDAIGREGTLLGSWFTADPEGEDFYYATAMLGQDQAQMTWSYQARPEEVHKRLNPYDASAVLGSLAARPGSRGLAFRVGGRGAWSPPAVCDPETGAIVLLAPDDDARREWTSRILTTLLPILREWSPPAPLPDASVVGRPPAPAGPGPRRGEAAMADGTIVERPSLLMSPGEWGPSDTAWPRLRRLARLGLPLVGPSSPENDEVRLALAYLAEDDRAALDASDALLAWTEAPDRRLRLMAIQAQIFLMRRDFGRARGLIDYLRGVRIGPSHMVEERIDRPRLVRVTDPRGGWPGFLAEMAEALKKPPVEPSQD